MPFVKSNWACEPALAEDGAFEFGKAFTLRGLSLHRGSQTRPCFLHVSSEAECRVKTLTLIAAAEVEILDVFALLGSLESMDYRKLGTVKGSRMENGRVFFNVNTAPFPLMWQLQLKVSSRAPTVVIHELSVQVDKTACRAGIPSASTATTSSISTSSKHLGDTDMFHTGRSSLGTSLNASATGKSRHNLDATADFHASATTNSLGLSRSRAAAASTSSLAVTTTTSKPSASAASTATSSTHPLAASTTTTVLASFGGTRAGATSTALATGGPSSAETAAVASVLNAVCEKMVGVVSEKTKAYLAKAGKRTERRVLDKMAKLEARIERFDDVLQHTTASSSQIEETLLALSRELLSPRMPVATSS